MTIPSVSDSDAVICMLTSSGALVLGVVGGSWFVECLGSLGTLRYPGILGILECIHGFQVSWRICGSLQVAHSLILPIVHYFSSTKFHCRYTSKSGVVYIQLYEFRIYIRVCIPGPTYIKPDSSNILRLLPRVHRDPRETWRLISHVCLVRVSFEILGASSVLHFPDYARVNGL